MSTKMTMKDQLRLAITTGDANTCVRIAGHLRALGLDYNMMLTIARRITEPNPVDAAEWDGLLYEGEANENR